MESGEEGGGPNGSRDGFPIEFTDEEAERFKTNFEPRAKLLIEIAKADNGVQRASMDGDWPVTDTVVLGTSGHITVGRNIVTDEFNAIGQEVALRQFEG